MSSSVAKIPTKPKGFSAVTATISVADISAALGYYQEAMEAEVVETLSVPQTDKMVHAVIKIAGTTVVLVLDENALPYAGPGHVTLHHYLDDVDAAFERVVAAGAVVSSSIVTNWWGDKTAVVVDPFGVRWSLAQRVEQLKAADRQARLDEFYAEPIAPAEPVEDTKEELAAE